jgi:hypothetical protein
LLAVHSRLHPPEHDELGDEHLDDGAELVSNTATSMGRLVLNVLLSFAQFEREIIAERTRDKIAATRRKGKWSGSTPVLVYDLDPRGRRLHVNDEEATRVRVIFALYLEHQALLPVVQELVRRGWVGKCWQTRDGRPRGGRPFDKTSLYRLLTYVLYAGKVRYKDEIHDGEQPALGTAIFIGHFIEFVVHPPDCLALVLHDAAGNTMRRHVLQNRGAKSTNVAFLRPGIRPSFLDPGDHGRHVGPDPEEFLSLILCQLI